MKQKNLKQRIFLSSLKRKIIIFYLLGLIPLIVILFITQNLFSQIFSLLNIEEQISEVFLNVLEIRRYEKNFLLYKNLEDLKNLENYLIYTISIIEKNQKEFQKNLNPEIIAKLFENLKNYQEILKNFKEKPEKEEFKVILRNAGKNLTEIAEKINSLKKEKINTNILKIKTFLNLLILFLLIGGILLGSFFYYNFRKPLVILESYIKELVSGKYSYIPLFSQDEEIILLIKALNKTLYELELKQRQLIQSEKLAALGTLLFSIVHSINNPLNNIYTTLQILKEEIESKNVEFKKILISDIESEIERTNNIIKNVLDYYKFGKKKFFSLKSLVFESLEILKSKISPFITIEIDIPEDIKIYVDPQLMKQVFLNLINNALDAMKEGKGKISIKASKETDWIKIEISDTGKGIEPENLYKIFEPFFTTKENKKGLGLGLFIVFHIIRMHKGSIDVISNPGVGTTFIIKLPLGGEEEIYTYSLWE